MLGRDDLVDKYEEEVLQEVINPIEDFEVTRYAHKDWTKDNEIQSSIEYEFYFYNRNTDVTAYVKVAESGNPRAMSFCGRCATMIHTGNTDDTGLLSLRLGGCEQKHELNPQFQIWCQSSMDWVEVEGGIKMPDQGGISAR